MENKNLGREMAQWGSVLDTKDDDGLSLLSGTHMVEGESRSNLLPSTGTPWDACVRAHIQVNTKTDRCMVTHLWSSLMRGWLVMGTDLSDRS